MRLHTSHHSAPQQSSVLHQVREAALPAPSEIRQFRVHWASCEDDVRAAQRLRYRVFAQEMGASLRPPAGTAAGLDVDRFDAFCDHLLVRTIPVNRQNHGTVVGTYRVLSPAAAVRAGGLYTDTEFDLAPLAHLRATAVELGRSCVHPGWRSGGVILALWSALGQYMLCHDLDTMIGCASIGIGDGGAAARALWDRLAPTHLVAPCLQIKPHHALRLDAPRTGENELRGTPRNEPMVATPPLIKGYLRCGARLLGPPALDTVFNTADLPMIMRLDDMTSRYRKHFLGS